MPRIKMTVVTAAEAKGRTFLTSTFAGPALKSSGDLSYGCGRCGAELLAKVWYKQVSNIVVKCGHCGERNIVPPSL